MAEVVAFKSRRRLRPWVRRRPGRLAGTPWRSLAVWAGMTGALWLGAALYQAGGLDQDGGLARHLGDQLQHRTSATGGGAGFVLCGGVARQNCVIDGDTIRMGGIKIRLADIDAPEVFSPKCPSELARGKRATQRLLELVNAGPFEVVRAGARDVDRYGRELRTLERAGRSLGAILVAEGLARPWDGARRSWCG